MQVKVPSNHLTIRQEKRKSNKFSLFVKRRGLVLLFLVVIFVFSTSLITIEYLSGWLKKTGNTYLAERVGYKVWGNVGLLQAVSRVPARWFNTLGADIPTLVIDIKFKHLQKLYKKRADALAKKILVQGPDDFVPAAIRQGNKTTKVELRLKGDLTDHLQGKKWSLRIHVKGKNHIFGLRRFSIQHPMTRTFQGEVLFFETLRHVGVLTPRYFFVNVIVNGDDIGIMAVEEHFSKELLEANGRREGVIIRFDESWFWGAELPSGKTFVFNSYKNVPIDAFRFSRIAKSEKLSRDYAIAVGLLRGFVNGELSASKVFDVELMGRFLAVAELWGAYHSIRWHNQRYYLNPLTMKLEPIGFDADIYSSAAIQKGDYEGKRFIQNSAIVAAMLNDPAIQTAYSKVLRHLANDIKNGGLIKKLKDIEQLHLPALQNEFFLLDEFPAEKLLARANALLEPASFDLGYPAILLANRIQSEQGAYLELASVIPAVVEVQSVQWIAKKDESLSLSFEPIDKIAFPIRLPPTPNKAVPQFRRVHYIAPSEPDRYTLQVSAKISGAKRIYQSNAQRYAAPLKKHPIPKSSKEEQLSQHTFLSLDEEKRAFYVKQGQWQVNGSLIIPKGFSLTIPQGTTLQFGRDDGLIARGSLHFQGTEKERIVLEGIVTTGNNEEATWQGVAVLSADAPSEWSYVTVRNTTGVHRQGWELTGGVTFYRSDIQLEHCIFQGNRGEDALNIIHAQFKLKDVQMMDTASDGFDADFTEGTVEGGLFHHIGTAGGGDGIDISGSLVTVNDTRFHHIADKALSVGEQSKMTATNVTITQTGIGAASKDGSQLDISHSTFEQVQNAALMAYVKKPEFGAGTIDAHHLTFGDTTTHARVQKGSIIRIDDHQVESEEIEVEQLYQTVMKPRLRQ